MELTVLVVPGCPHAGLLEQRLAVVLAGRPDATISRRVIADAEQAQRWSMPGSPTLLIDGVDPVRQVRAAGKALLPALSQQHRQDRGRPGRIRTACDDRGGQ